MMDRTLKKHVDGVNKAGFSMAALLAIGTIFFKFDEPLATTFAWIMWGIAACCVVPLVQHILEDYKLRKVLDDMMRTGSGAHSARFASREEIREAGMLDGKGRPLGWTDDGDILFEPHRHSPVHQKIIATNGAGKTTGGVVPAIMHLAMSPERRSLVIVDLKSELAGQCAMPLMRAGHEVWVVDPARETDLRKTELNILEPLVNAAANDSSDVSMLARFFAQTLEPEPPGEQNNKYFRDGPRDLLRFGAEGLARFAPEDCTPSGVAAVLGDEELFERMIEQSIACGGSLGTLAKRLVEKRQENSNHFSDFKTTALQRLEIYEEGGRLYECGSNAFYRYEEIRERQVIVFLVSSLSQAKEMRTHFILQVSNFLHVAKRTGHPIDFVLDEFTSAPVKSLVEDLTIIRQFGSRVLMIAQAESEIERQFSDKSAKTIDDLASVKQIMGVSRFDEAKRVSDALGKGPFATMSLSEGDGALKGSLRDEGRPLLTPDEVLALGRHRQIIFCDGMKPIIANKLYQNEIAPMCDLLDPNPLERAKLPSRPRVEITYGNNVEGTLNQVRTLMPVKKLVKPKGVSVLRLAHFNWLGWSAALGTIAVLLFGGLSLRFSYEYTQAGRTIHYERCEYVGATGRITVYPPDGECELVMWSWRGNAKS